MSGDALVNTFYQADLYVHTPRVINWKFEGFGIVYLEASACGLPILATDMGGVRDAVVDGITGIVLSENDPVQISATLNELLDNPCKLEKLGIEGRKYAEKHDWSHIVDKYLSIYHALDKK